VKRPGTPEVNAADWPTKGLDHFVLHQIEGAGLRPAEEAGKAV